MSAQWARPGVRVWGSELCSQLLEVALRTTLALPAHEGSGEGAGPREAEAAPGDHGL